MDDETEWTLITFADYTKARGVDGPYGCAAS